LRICSRRRICSVVKGGVKVDHGVGVKGSH
jgi:hypothetical protein